MRNLVGTDIKIQKYFRCSRSAALLHGGKTKKQKSRGGASLRRRGKDRISGHPIQTDLNLQICQVNIQRINFCACRTMRRYKTAIPACPKKRGTVKLIVKSNRKSKDGMKQEIRLINPGGKSN